MSRILAIQTDALQNCWYSQHAGEAQVKQMSRSRQDRHSAGLYMHRTNLHSIHMHVAVDTDPALTNNKPDTRATKQHSLRQPGRASLHGRATTGTARRGSALTAASSPACRCSKNELQSTARWFRNKGAVVAQAQHQRRR
jgi:hypothetical protein